MGFPFLYQLSFKKSYCRNWHINTSFNPLLAKSKRQKAEKNRNEGENGEV
jgi:hypothetical protein